MFELVPPSRLPQTVIAHWYAPPQPVARAAELGRLAGREIANAAEAREILGVTKKI